MRYQWGRKDPFTFATNSENWGGDFYNRGMHPVKLYNGNNVLIYQVDSGADNSGKLPSGGVLAPGTAASSMSAVVANPITIYGDWGPVINQSGQSGDLYNYYWTSYSRGTDGEAYPNPNNPQWHNLYLDSYIPLRHKSIYDPCPYGYRIPSNGTYNQFTPNKGWTLGSYMGGRLWIDSWLLASGRPDNSFAEVGREMFYQSSTRCTSSSQYVLYANSETSIIVNHSSPNYFRLSVRCIEECELLPDATEASAGY